MTETQIGQDANAPSNAPLNASLIGQVAVVTGAARGIGEAIALRLARMGAAVVLTARDSARLTQVRAAIEQQSGKALVLPCDLTDPKAVAAFGERVREQCGRCGPNGKQPVAAQASRRKRAMATNPRATPV